MPEPVSIHYESFSIPPVFSFAQDEAAKSSDLLRGEFFAEALQSKLVAQQSFEEFFDALTDELHRKVQDANKGTKSAVRTKAELQPNGCYSSPTYEAIIDKAAQKIYDPKDLGDIDKMRHMYDCRIKNDTDAVRYAAQALKFDNDPYTAVILNQDLPGLLGLTIRPEAPAEPVKPGAKPAQQWLTIESVQEKGPAATAGLRPGDQVRAVDGVSMAGKSIPEVANILRGAANTVVLVSVMRKGVLKNVEMTRVAIEVSQRAGGETHQAGIGAGVGLLSKDLNHLSRDNSKTIAAKNAGPVPQENDLVLASIIAGSPAERAGLKRGDIVRKVDGQPIAGLTIDGATAKIRGAAGRAVDLTILRSGKLIDFSIIRAPLKGDAVVTDKSLGEGVAYIKFTDFSHSDGTQQLMNAMNRQKDAKAIVLDLRNNPGGELFQAIKNISMFLWKGDVMTMDSRIPSPPDAPRYESIKISVTGDSYITTFDDGEQKPVVDTRKRAVPYLLNGRPLVILTNGNSASASELFAGALHDNGVAKLIGEKTYGKGIGQNHEENLGFTQLTTTFRYYTPKGFWPGDAHNNRVGISPDLPVRDSLSQGDPQLDAAIDYLKNILVQKKK